MLGQRDWPHAAALVRRATGIEPRNPHAWRYLADSLIKQGKPGAAGQAPYRPIAANPADRDNCARLVAFIDRDALAP